MKGEDFEGVRKLGGEASRTKRASQLRYFPKVTTILPILIAISIPT